MSHMQGLSYRESHRSLSRLQTGRRLKYLLVLLEAPNHSYVSERQDH
jgi:hypothetical protein